MNNTTNFTDLLEIGVKTADILIYHEDNNLIYEKASKFLYHQLEGFISQIRFYVTDKHGENFQEEVIYGERGWRPGYDFIPYYQLPGIIRKKKGFFRFNDDTHNYVLVPLVTAGQVLGLLEFQSVEEISDKIVEGLRQMSDTIALGISHNIFKENTIKSKKNTDVSIQINHKLQSITDLSELISYFMKLSVKYFKFDRITIFIFDNKNEIAFGRGIRENGGEFIVNEYPELPDLSKNTMPLKNGMGYWFPLKTNTGIVGMALFDNIYTQYEISTTLLDSLRILCSQFASAIDNIRLFSDLETSAFIDPLTGLYNRAYLEKIIPDFNQDDYLPLSVIIGDVNGLKITNDVFGHNAGDELLTRIAEIIQHSCRKEDLVIRWGGDEYVVFLPNTQQETADKICWKIKNACLDQTDTKVQLSISLGYATRYSMDDNLKSVMKEAEDRMYRHKLLETRNFRSSLMESLKATLVEKCYEPAGHSERMTKLAVRVGLEMGLIGSELEDLKLLAMLHDIGKVAVSNEILSKPGLLTRKEWKEVKKHPEAGYRIAQASFELSQIANYILCHHERWDGKGYPLGKKGKEIPLLSRIVAVVDAYDVMTDDRPYKDAISHEEAMVELYRCAGTQFDPEIVELFTNLDFKNREKFI